MGSTAAQRSLSQYSNIRNKTPVDENTKVILLNAGYKSIWIANKEKMNSWFDIYTENYKDLDRFCDKDQLEESRLKITDLIHREVRENLGGDYSKLMIGGFSQGAALALYIASKLTPDAESAESSDCPVSKKNEKNSKRGPEMKTEYQNQFNEHSSRSISDNKFNEMQVDDHPKKKIKNNDDDFEETKKSNSNLGAVIFCSGFLLFKNPSTEIFKINQFPIFVYHGIYDEMIYWKDTVKPFSKYFDENIVLTHTENMGHSMDDLEWRKIGEFLKLINDKNNV